MTRFKVNHHYGSNNNGQQYGPWRVGTVVDVADDEAAWINRDSPGTLSPDEPAPDAMLELAGSQPPADEDKDDEAVQPKPPTRDRMHRGSRKRPVASS